MSNIHPLPAVQQKPYLGLLGVSAEAHMHGVMQQAAPYLQMHIKQDRRGLQQVMPHVQTLTATQAVTPAIPPLMSTGARLCHFGARTPKRL